MSMLYSLCFTYLFMHIFIHLLIHPYFAKSSINRLFVNTIVLICVPNLDFNLILYRNNTLIIILFSNVAYFNPPLFSHLFAFRPLYSILITSPYSSILSSFSHIRYHYFSPLHCSPLIFFFPSLYP